MQRVKAKNKLTSFYFVIQYFSAKAFRNTISAAVASSYQMRKCDLLAFLTRGGGTMGFITWNDAIQIALLIFAIIACFRNKKR